MENYTERAIIQKELTTTTARSYEQNHKVKKVILFSVEICMLRL